MENCGVSSGYMFASWLDHGDHQRRVDYYETTSAGRLGEYTGNCIYRFGRNSIRTSDLDDLAFGTCGKFEHSHDVDTDPRKLSVVCKSGG